MLEELALKLRVRKREYVVQQGHRTDCLFFITAGLFRGTHVSDGEEDTLFFGVPGDPFTSVHAFAHGELAQISLQALEHSEVIAVRYDDFRRLISEREDLMGWWNTVLLEQLYALERRYVEIGTSLAERRYGNLLRVRSEIINRIPLKYVAQYLSVTPETLSRVRRRMFRSTGKKK